MIEILDCPFSIEIKDDLIKWFKSEKNSEIPGFTLKTEELVKPKSPEIERLLDWIESVIPRVAVQLAKNSYSLFNADFRRNTANFKIDSYWGLYYNLHSFIVPHSHFPHALSFGYYINVPTDSSPFTILQYLKDEIDYYPKEGQLFVFDSSLLHVVRPTPVAGRTVIAGDITYLSRFVT